MVEQRFLVKIDSEGITTQSVREAIIDYCEASDTVLRTVEVNKQAPPQAATKPMFPACDVTKLPKSEPEPAKESE